MSISKNIKELGVFMEKSVKYWQLQRQVFFLKFKKIANLGIQKTQIFLV
jgi:hypothetical protein